MPTALNAYEKKMALKAYENDVSECQCESGGGCERL